MVKEQFKICRSSDELKGWSKENSLQELHSAFLRATEIPIWAKNILI